MEKVVQGRHLGCYSCENLLMFVRRKNCRRQRRRGTFKNSRASLIPGVAVDESSFDISAGEKRSGVNSKREMVPWRLALDSFNSSKSTTHRRTSLSRISFTVVEDILPLLQRMIQSSRSTEKVVIFFHKKRQRKTIVSLIENHELGTLFFSNGQQEFSFT